MKFIYSISLLLILVGCQDQQEKQISKQEAGNLQTDNDPQSNDASGCYMRVTGRDTSLVSLQQNSNGTVNGKLSINNFEKDDSKGTLKGTEADGVFKLLYTFQSEGMQSVMEIYFKKTANGLIRGIGEMLTKGDTSYFTTPSAVSFSENEIMNNIPCEDRSGE